MTERDRKVLELLAKYRGGRAVVDIERHVPGGRPGPTLVSLERRGFVKLNRYKYIGNHGAKLAGAYITMAGLEALLLANPNAEVHER